MNALAEKLGFIFEMFFLFPVILIFFILLYSLPLVYFFKKTQNKSILYDYAVAFVWLVVSLFISHHAGLFILSDFRIGF
jgi:hypothetical protein